MSKPLKTRFYNLFYNRSYSNFLPNTFIFNPILSIVSIHPTQHSHFYIHRVYSFVEIVSPYISFLSYGLNKNAFGSSATIVCSSLQKL
ncbi:hypothetical protein Lalb_Chr03g0031691 [Lupinus albus]|uniref:Uncharacterized protein n=1 Tax=Lupinus albus TaxID=3870 RepID=A0A6A4QV14_LUPAL|nr:hypothetical protein Lalb_Chr03g0031691 [Lupinus albus]